MSKGRLILFVLIICFCCSSCAREVTTNNSASNPGTTGEINLPDVQIQALELGSADADDGGVHSFDYSYWSPANLQSRKDSSAPKTATVSFEGKTYEGIYESSHIATFNTYQTDVYNFSGGEFCLNAETGELVQIVFYDPSKNLGDVNFSIDECQLIAEKLVSKYVSNISDYKLEVDDKPSYLPGFRYIRQINGIQTSEIIIVGISAATGEVCTFGSTMLGAFDQVETSLISDEITRLQSTEAEAVLKEKIDEIYSDYDSFETRQFKLVLLKEGGIGIVYTISVKNVTELDSGHTIFSSDHTEILLRCNNP